MIRQSHLYDDLRQVLFACPAAALLLALGTRHLVHDIGRSASGVARTAALAVWSLALAGPMLVQLQLFPYAYAYASPQSDIVNAPTEPDFWRTSFRELAPKVPLDEFVVCSPVTTDDGITMRYTSIVGRPAAEASTNCLTDEISPLTPYIESVSPRGARVSSSFVALFERGKTPGANCRATSSITRARYLESVVMSTLARCDLVLTPYPDAGVVMGPDSGAGFLLGGWSSSASSAGVRLKECFGSLGVELPASWEQDDLRVTLAGSADEVPEMWVNNERVSASTVSGGWEAEVPVPTVEAMGERRLVVTVAQPTGESLVLTALRVDPLE
jgi:hypothetical protein